MGRRPLTLSLIREEGLESVEVPKLELWARGEGTEARCSLGLEPVTVGSAPDCTLRLLDSRVSRRHCELRLSPEGLRLRDLDSKNGTWVSGVSVLEAWLSPGTRFVIGETELEVTDSGESERLPLASTARFGDALGASLPMRVLFGQLERLAGGNDPLLLLGQSGSGKGVLARAIHSRSPRANGPFVVFDCGAVSPSLIESALFGHERGAFTGAIEPRAGVFEEAHQGTLLLDEIGELALEQQPRLLRVLEARTIRRLGGGSERPADVRVISATHRPLRELCASGAFREDLYHRLAAFELTVPPLRERGDDVLLLAEQFLAELTPPRALSDLPPNTGALLRSHDWPGNVRELRNTLSRLALFPELGRAALEGGGRRKNPLWQLPLREARELAIADFERRYLEERLAIAEGNVSRAAAQIGVSRQHLHLLLARHGLRSKEDDALG